VEDFGFCDEPGHYDGLVLVVVNKRKGMEPMRRKALRTAAKRRRKKAAHNPSPWRKKKGKKK